MKINELYKKNEHITFRNYLEKCGIDDYNKYVDSIFLEPNENYDNIDKARDIIISSETIHILMDTDVDGLMTALIQYMFLKRIGKNVIVHFHNKEKAHGLNDVINDLIDLESSTMWIGDASSNDVKECKMLFDKGWSVVITDHHNLEKDKEDIFNYATIVNNQLSKNVSNKNLSGAGVTWKLCNHICSEIANEFISYVHVANVGDNMSFASYENQCFRYWGNQSIHPNLAPFINSFNENGELRNLSFSFGIVSRFNSVIRVGTKEEKEILFNALIGEGDFEKAIKVCKSCKTKQDNERDRIVNEINILHNGKIFIGEVPKTSLTGMIANKILESYKKPLLLVHNYDGVMSGSVRSTIDFKDIANESGLFIFNQGHSRSHGTSYKLENQDKIIDYFENMDLPEPSETVLKKYTTNSVDRSIWSNLVQYKDYYGNGLEDPSFMFTFTFNPSNMNIVGKYGTTLTYTDNRIKFIWRFINRYKKVDLKLGYLDYEDCTSYGEPRFVESKSDKLYTMNVIGTLNGDNEVIVNKWWLEDYKKKSVEDIF